MAATISQEKREFLKHLSRGIYEIIELDDMAEIIHEGQNIHIEKYISEHFIGFSIDPSSCFKCRMQYWFLHEEFSEALDSMPDSLLIEILDYFEENDLELSRIYKKSRAIDKMKMKTSSFDELIQSGKMTTFKQFIEYK